MTGNMTLRDRLTGTINWSGIRANNHKLSNLEEQSLLKWVISMDSCGAVPWQSHMQEMASILLAEHGSTLIQTVSQNWVYNFIKHQPELTMCFSHQYDYQCA